MRRLIATIVAAVAVALVATACLPASPPAENGRLPESSLTTITPSCRVVNEIADDLSRMLAAAAGEGVTLAPESKTYLDPLPNKPPRNESCYRSYEIQVWWRELYCFFGICQYAAVPGTSVHGWGRAVDFEDADGELQFGSPASLWLQAHAASYGFVHPGWAAPWGASPEPWHWEHP